MNELIVLKQLPIIEENLKSLSDEINKKVENAKALVCNDDTVKEVKKLRAELNKEFKKLETQRKLVKTEIEKPYKEFEEIYKKYISDKFGEADTELSNKINEVESEIKHNTELKMKEFFEEYRAFKSIIREEYLSFNELEIKVGLNLITEKGDLVKKVKDEIKNKVDSIANEIETISTMQYSDEVLVEYLKSKNLSLAIKEVNDRHIALEQVQIQKEEAKEIISQEQEVIEKVDEVLQAPDIIEGQMYIDDFEEKVEDEIVEIEIRLKGTVKNPPTKKIKMIGEKTDLKIFIQCLSEGGYEYE